MSLGRPPRAVTIARVQAIEIVSAGRHRFRGERPRSRRRLRERGLAQIELRRKALERPEDDAARVESLDLADRRHGERRKRPVEREAVHDVAEGVLRGAQAAFDVEIDAPMRNVLAFMGARGETQRLDDGLRRALVTVMRLVTDAQAHAGLK